jgi:hypothetical protein
VRLFTLCTVTCAETTPRRRIIDFSASNSQTANNQLIRVLDKTIWKLLQQIISKIPRRMIFVIYL